MKIACLLSLAIGVAFVSSLVDKCTDCGHTMNRFCCQRPDTIWKDDPRKKVCCDFSLQTIPDKDTMEVINAHPELSIAAKFITKAKFDVKLRNNAEPFTVFIPNNDAFKNLEATIDSMPIEGKYGIAEIIGRHTVTGHGRVMSTKLNERNGWLISVDNYNEFGNIIFKGEDDFLIAREPTGMDKSRKVLEADILSSDGVIHIIDGIL